MTKYTEEIREIRKMINEGIAFNDNYAHKRTDEELQDYVTYLPQKDTGLSKDILVDTGENYKFFNHPLCIYIIDGENVYPVTVSNSPKSPTGIEIPMDIMFFVQRSVRILQEVADIKIGADIFFDYIENYKDQIGNISMVGEMSNLPPQMTGLSVWVYVDDTDSYLKSGHNGSYRIKFQQDKALTNPRQWMPILIPSLTIMNNGKLPPCKISNKEVNNVILWAKGNLELLEKLKNKDITGDVFKQEMKQLPDIKIILDSEIKNK